MNFMVFRFHTDFTQTLQENIDQDETIESKFQHNRIIRFLWSVLEFMIFISLIKAFPEILLLVFSFVAQMHLDHLIDQNWKWHCSSNPIHDWHIILIQLQEWQ